MKIASSVLLTAALLFPGGGVYGRVVYSDGPDQSQQPDSNRFIVTYKDTQGAVAARSRASQVHVELARQNAVAGTYPPQAIAGLQNNPHILSIEVDQPRTTQMMIRGGSGTAAAAHGKEGDTHRNLAESSPYGIEMVEADQVEMGTGPRKVSLSPS